MSQANQFLEVAKGPAGNTSSFDMQTNYPRTKPLLFGWDTPRENASASIIQGQVPGNKGHPIA